MHHVTFPSEYRCADVELAERVAAHFGAMRLDVFWLDPEPSGEWAARLDAAAQSPRRRRPAPSLLAGLAVAVVGLWDAIASRRGRWIG